MWSTTVLLPKGGCKYCVIGLVEVLWKVISIIIYQRLTDSIEFHDILHGFRACRGTGMATLESKILQHISGLQQDMFYEVFVYIHNAYDALDRGHALEILEGYGVDPSSAVS